MDIKYTVTYNDRYYYSPMRYTDNVNNCKKFDSFSDLLKAIKDKYTENHSIIDGVHLIQLGLDKDNDVVAVLDYGELWACVNMYGLGLAHGSDLALRHIK